MSGFVTDVSLFLSHLLSHPWPALHLKQPALSHARCSRASDARCDTRRNTTSHATCNTLSLRYALARHLPFLVVGAFIASLALTASTASAQSSDRLIVHEWGVLTTIVLPDGKFADWSPLEILTPQPGFIQSIPITQTTSKIRFDLPAVFFRVDRPLDISMQLEWLDGYFASCYPRAQISDHSLSWQNATIMPGSAFPLLQEPSASHYYQARHTTASFVRVDYFGHKQYERFLTLRAIGDLPLPVAVTVNQEEFTFVQSPPSPSMAVPQAILIENVDGKLGFEIIDLKATSPTINPRLKHDANIDMAAAKLRKMLNQHGLFPDEAAAAVAGIRQNWFGPGVRVIYMLPRPIIDAAMKMNISPKPTEHQRLYAVRMELITPKLIQQVKLQLVGMDATDQAANNDFMLSSPLIRPLLAKLLDDMQNQTQHLHICDKITLLLKQPLAQK